MVRLILILCVAGSLLTFARGQELTTIRQSFDQDPGWEAVNNRIRASDPPTVKQDFGWSPSKGIGGVVWQSTTPSYYAMPIGKALSFKDKFSASGKISFPGSGKADGTAYIGFFNHE